MRVRKQAWHERSAVSTFAKHIREDAGWEKPPFGKPGRTNSFVAVVTSVSLAGFREFAENLINLK